MNINSFAKELYHLRFEIGQLTHNNHIMTLEIATLS